MATARCTIECAKASFRDLCPDWIGLVNDPPLPANITAGQKQNTCACIAPFVEAMPTDELIDNFAFFLRTAGPSDQLKSLTRAPRIECLKKLGIFR